MQRIDTLVGTPVAALISSLLAALLFYIIPSTFAADWFPGLVFGTLFAAANLRKTEYIISFSVLSGLSFWLAVEAEKKSLAFPWLPAGLAGGAVGTTLLVLSLMFLVALRVDPWKSILTIITGTIAGRLFVVVGKASDNGWGSLATFLQFFIWQLPVGILLSTSLNRSDAMDSPPVESKAWQDQVSRFLQSPIVALIGLISSILGILSFLLSK